MAGRFPTRKGTGKTAEIGINVASTVFNDYFGWIFRRTHQEHDFGVDGYIDHVAEGGSVTGRSIACQIKTGASYLSASGNVHWYKDSTEHLNYFLNLPTPLILIICDPDARECYWAVLEKENVDFQEKGWRHPIPKNQVLNKKNIKEIEKLFGEAKDHVSDFEEDCRMLNAIGKDTFIQYSIPRSDIIKQDTSKLKSFITRISRNEKLALAVQGQLYICTYGYEQDAREVHQIKEIRCWAAKARDDINSWYLCANTDNWMPSTLIWMAACTCSIKSKPARLANGRKGHKIVGNTQDMLTFMDECFSGLNEATDKWGWSNQYNYNVSKMIHDELFPGMPFPELER